MKQITKNIFTFIITIMMFCSVTKSANAQKCSPIHSCPAGYTCVNFHCEKVVSPPPYFCRCSLRNYGCKTIACIYGCAATCTFLSEENNEPSSITISSGSVPRIITINFQLEDAASISLKIYEATGSLIRTLTAEYMQQGSHQIEWDEKDEDGNTVSAGIYILQFDTPNRSETKKLPVIN